MLRTGLAGVCQACADCQHYRLLEPTNQIRPDIAIHGDLGVLGAKIKLILSICRLTWFRRQAKDSKDLEP